MNGFFSKDDEILLVGPGLSSTLDYFDSNDYEGITIFDFSETLTNYLKQKYNKEWEIATFNICGSLTKSDILSSTVEIIITSFSLP